jgi:hypothetical protein
MRVVCWTGSGEKKAVSKLGQSGDELMEKSFAYCGSMSSRRTAAAIVARRASTESPSSGAATVAAVCIARTWSWSGYARQRARRE